MGLAHGHQEPLEGIDFAIASKDEIAAFIAAAEDVDPKPRDRRPVRLINAQVADPAQLESLITAVHAMNFLPPLIRWELSNASLDQELEEWSPLALAIEKTPKAYHDFANEAIFDFLGRSKLKPIQEPDQEFPYLWLTLSTRGSYRRFCDELKRLPVEAFGTLMIHLNDIEVNVAELYSVLCQSGYRAHHVSLTNCELSWQPSQEYSFHDEACISTRIVSQNPLDPEVFYAFRAALPHISIQLGILPNMLEILRDPRADELLTVMEVYCA